MLPKAHLTSHSRMSGSRWVITPSWLSGSWRSFLYSSVYSCHLLISSASVRSIPFLSFIVPIFAWNVPLVSLMFLKISSLSHSIVFLYFFALITEEGFLSLLAILWNSAFKWVYLFFSPLPLASILFSVICKTSSDNHFAFFPYAPANHKSSYLPISFLLHALVHFFSLLLKTHICFLVYPWQFFSHCLESVWIST